MSGLFLVLFAIPLSLGALREWSNVRAPAKIVVGRERTSKAP